MRCWSRNSVQPLRGRARESLLEPARVPQRRPRAACELWLQPGLRDVGDIGDPVRREGAPAGRQRGLADIAATQHTPWAIDVVELAEARLGQREHVGRRARGCRARLRPRPRLLDARGRESTPQRCTPGVAAAMRRAGSPPAPQPSSSTRAWRGSGGVEPVQRRDRRETARERLRERGSRSGPRRRLSACTRNLFPRRGAHAVRVGASAGRRRRTAQHAARGPRRGAAHAAAARARAPRLRGRRDRVRRAGHGVVGQAHEPDRRPLPLRPARERRQRAQVDGARRPRQRHARWRRRRRCASRCTYAVTAWTKAVEDEHRLLSQVLAILFSYRSLPADLLDGPARGRQPAARDRDRGRPAEGGEGGLLDARSAASYKASIDYAVKLAVESGAHVHARARGADADGAHRAHRRPARARSRSCSASAASSRDKDGEPVADAWVALPDLGRFAATDREGRFRFDRCAPGEHRVDRAHRRRARRRAAGRRARRRRRLDLGGGPKKTRRETGMTDGHTSLPEWLPSALSHGGRDRRWSGAVDNDDGAARPARKPRADHASSGMARSSARTGPR